jgi:hypothetical protein
MFKDQGEERELSVRIRRIGYRMQRERREQFRALLDQVELPDVSVIPARQNRSIRNYLARRRPLEAIGEIEDRARALRESLLEHFSIADILIEVGDKRTTRDNPWVG